MQKPTFPRLATATVLAGLIANSCLTSRANTELWFGVTNSSITTNWSDNLNWTNTSGGGNPGPNGNDVVFGDLGAVGTSNIVNSVVDQNLLNPLSLAFTNGSAGALFHTILIPAGISVTNANYLTVGRTNLAANNYIVVAAMVGGGTLVQKGTTMTIANSSTTASGGSMPTFDLSGLTNFVATGIGTLNIAGGGGESRGEGTLNLAQNSVVFATNITMNTGSGNPANTGGTINLGGTTNAINVTTWVVGQTKGNTSKIQWAGPTGGLRIRGITGADSDRNVSITLGDRNNTGSATTAGQFLFNGHQVDIKANTMLIGQDRSGSSSSTHAGSGLVRFDTGTMDVTTINMAVMSSTAAGASANGNIVVGSGGALIIGTGGLSLANQTSTGLGSGGLSLLGGSVTCSNSIKKTSTAGFGGITNYAGNLNLVIGGIGVFTNTVDQLVMSNATLTLASVDANTTNVFVGNLDTENGGDTTVSNTIAIGLLPGIASFPADFHMILYTNGTTGITGAGFNFLVSGISGLYTYYVTNYTTTLAGNTVGFIDLVVTAGPVAKAITWRGTPTGNWNITDLDWLASAVPANFNQGDFVTFDDTASGTTTVNLTGTMEPTTLTVNNTSKAYTFNGGGSIGGLSTLIKQGANTLLLDNGANNTFSGATTISAGTVQIGNGDTGGSLGSGAVANNGAIVFNRTDTPALPNVMSGNGGLTNGGAGSVLTVSGANGAFTGAVMVAQGTIKLGNNLALGSTNSGTTVANNAMLDLNGFSATNIQVTAIGSGIAGAGAIVNNGTAVLQPGLNHVNLAGNTTFGGATRWDIRLTGSGATDPRLATLSTGGNGYNLTKVGTNFIAISSVTVDPALANIDIQGGTLSFENNTTTLGNPASTLTVELGATLELFSPTNLVNKLIVLNGNGTNTTFIQGSGTATVIGPVTMNGSNIWSVTGASLNLNSAIGGAAPLTKIGSGYLILSGNNTYTNTTTVTNGTLALNGVNSGLPGLVNTMTNTTLVGTGSNAGAVTVGGNLNAGDVASAGTLTVGALTLSAGATATFDLGTTTTVGSGVNDLVQVNGNLALNNNSIVVNLLQGTLAAGTYRLFNYTGTLGGSFNPTVTLSTPGATRYSFVLNTATSGQVNLVVSGAAANLKWNGATDNTWDIGTTPNWVNTGTTLADSFFQGDSVLLDDTGIFTGINLTNAVAPSAMTNNSSANNFTITGPGKITGAASIVKLGSSTLMLGTANDFSGTVTVLAGTLQVTNNASLGATNGATIIASGATLDVAGLPVANTLNLGLEPIIVSGSGVGGQGAIINSTPGNIPQENATRLITLTGDTAFGGPGQYVLGNGTTPGRWDMRGTGTTLSTSGHAYNLAKVGNNQMSFVSVVVDTNLANIDIQQGMLGFENGCTSMGNPASNLVVEAGGSVLELFQSGTATNDYTKQFVLNNDGTSTNIYVFSGISVLRGTMTLNGACDITVAGTALTNLCSVSGTGGLTKGGSGTMVLQSPTYTGNTIISGGPLVLPGSASLASSPNVSLTLTNSTLDVSQRSDQTFTLAAGQTLSGAGTVLGNVTVGSQSTISPGNANNTALTISSNLVFNSGTNAVALGTPNGDNYIQTTNLTLNGVTTLAITTQSGVGLGSQHVVMQYAGALTGNEANLRAVGSGGFLYSVVPTASTPGTIQVLVTQVPSTYIWRGGAPGSPSTWDATHTNWYDTTFGNMTNFISGVFAQFDDNYNPPYTNITLVGTLDPLSMDFQNFLSTFTLLGSGKITGSGGLTMDNYGGTLVIANTGVNDFAGDVNILNGGTLQIGNGGTSGNIGTGNINTTNGWLVFNRSDNINIANALNGTSQLTNAGPGVLTLSGNNTLSGTYTIAQGTLRVNNNNALGGTTTQQGAVVVWPGATLDLGGSVFAAQAENLSNEVVVVSGSGVGGQGAIINSGTNSQFNALRNVMVVGDLYVGGPGYFLATNAVNPGRWDIRGSITNSALVTSNLQAYSLYKIGSNHVGLVGVTIDSSPGQSLGNIYVQQGKLQIESGTTSLGDVNSNLVVSAGAVLGFYQSSFTNNFTKQFILNGNGSSVTLSNENGTTTLNGTMDLEGGCIFGIGGTVISNNCSLTGAGSLTMNGAARLALGGTAGYTGNTTVSNGTLQFLSSIPSSPLFDIAGPGAVMDISAAGGALNLGSGQALHGGGTLRGSLNASGTAAVAVGEPAVIGTLTVTNAVTLSGSGTTTIKLNRTAGATNDILKAGTTMAVAGTLNVTLLGGTLQAGDSFTLFKANSGLSGTFSATNLPALPTGLAWVTTNLVNGIVSVMATVNTNPTNITAHVSGNILTLSWPADHTGWRLIAQTNSLATGLNPNPAAWTTVGGSTTVNSVNVTIDPTKGTVYYRLVYP